MFPRNENRNEGTFGCSPGTRVRSRVPPERKPGRGYIRQNHPFTKPPFYLTSSWLSLRSFEAWRRGRPLTDTAFTSWQRNRTRTGTQNRRNPSSRNRYKRVPNGLFQTVFLRFLTLAATERSQKDKEYLKTPLFSSILVPCTFADPDHRLNTPI